MRRAWIAPHALFPLFILLANLVIIWKLFSIEYSAYLESNEGTFIAIARQIASHPWDLQWFPQWEGGLPFQNLDAHASSKPHLFSPSKTLLTGAMPSRRPPHSA